jgi:hypothetical protein
LSSYAPLLLSSPPHPSPLLSIRLLLSDVMAERELQIEHKKMIQTIKKEQDKEYLEMRQVR